MRYGDLPVGSFFTFHCTTEPKATLCFKGGTGFQYITLGQDDQDTGPSVETQCECHPDNKVFPVTVFRTMEFVKG